MGQHNFAMRSLLFILILLLAPLPAFAGQAEAKDLARSLNCTVKNITVQSKTTGDVPTTLYKVECEVTGGSDEAKKANGTMLIRCEGPMCSLFKKGE
jgi:hypothetical protein